MTAIHEDTPVRDYMNDPKIKWRNGLPDYTATNEKYLRERSMNHKADSLEKLVENLVKTWEMESTHKVEEQDWGTVKKEVYRFSTNGGEKHDLQYNIDNGNYNMMLEGCPLYDIKRESNASSHTLFKTCFPDGFPWEVLEVQSGPPTVVFTWRHWGHFNGPFRQNPPTNELLEMCGSAIVKVDENLKITDLQVYFDPNPLLGRLMGHDPSKCPMSIHGAEK